MDKTPKRETTAMRQAKKIVRIEEVLRTLIGWIAQSSVGVLSISEAETLLRDLKEK